MSQGHAPSDHDILGMGVNTRFGISRIPEISDLGSSDFGGLRFRRGPISGSRSPDPGSRSYPGSQYEHPRAPKERYEIPRPSIWGIGYSESPLGYSMEVPESSEVPISGLEGSEMGSKWVDLGVRSG